MSTDFGYTKKFVLPRAIQNSPRFHFILFEVGNDARATYLSGHIPGAFYFDTNLIERPPLWNCIPDVALEQVLLAHGITHDQTVILYGRGSTAATRVAVILLYAGVKDVRLLDGGFQAWERAGLPIEQGENVPVPAPTFGKRIPAQPRVFVDIEGVRQMLSNEKSVVVSIRSWAEHIGETSGYDFIQAKGRIAGSVWGRGGTDKDGMEDFHNPDGTPRSLEEIAENWRRWGITPNKRVAFYCGTGWRASEAFFYAYAMGWKNIAVYDGGWLEWSGDSANPIETGIPAIGKIWVYRNYLEGLPKF